MSLLRSLDLYRVIVILSLLLLPAGGWWVTKLDESIAACKKTIEEARRSGGLLEQIGSLQRKIEVVVQNKRNMSETIKQPSIYFEGQILAAGGTALKVTDISPSAPREEKMRLPSSKQMVADYVVDIQWPRKDLSVTLDFVYAVLFNCESGARAVADQPQQSVWRLRELTLTNATEKFTDRTPPPELADKWAIDKMSFARREPAKAN
jgi:hypothetical protein